MFRLIRLVLLGRGQMPQSELSFLLLLMCVHLASSLPAQQPATPAPNFVAIFDLCPVEDKFQPCKCRTDSYEITCGNGISDPNTIRYIFQEASPAASNGQPSAPPSQSSQYRYSHLIFEHSPLEKLVSKSFEHFTFFAITIRHHYYLTSFDQDAFAPSNTVTTTLKFDSNPKLGYINESVYSLFGAVQSFSKLNVLLIHNCGLTFIPPNAFGAPGSGTLKYLKRVSLIHNAIKTIHTNAFVGLPMLRMLSLASNQIDRIESGAIKLVTHKCDNSQYSYSKALYFIELNNNRIGPESMNATSISVDCATELNLSNNSLTYLPEPIFRPLFAHYVKILLYGNALDCANCHMAWLLKGRFCSSYNSTLSSSSSSDALAAKYYETYPNDLIETDQDLLQCPTGGLNSAAVSAQPVASLPMLVFLFVAATFAAESFFLFLSP